MVLVQSKIDIFSQETQEEELMQALKVMSGSSNRISVSYKHPRDVGCMVKQEHQWWWMYADNTNVALCNIQALQMRVINGRCIPVEPPQEKLPNETPEPGLFEVCRHHP
jgi:hypothetical protein